MNSSAADRDAPLESIELDDGFEAWQNVIEQVVSQAALEDVLDAVEEIQAMEPDERFTESADQFHPVFASDTEEDINQLFDEYETSPISKEMYEAFDEVWTLLQRAVFQTLRRTRKHEQSRVLLGLYLEKANEAFVTFDHRLDNGADVASPLSVFIGLSSRLLQLVTSDDTIDDEYYRGILRAEFYLSDSDTMQRPDELSDREARKNVLLEGSALVSDEGDISVSRGAELADVPLETFEAELARCDIPPNYGPRDLDELVETSCVFPSGTEERLPVPVRSFSTTQR